MLEDDAALADGLQYALGKQGYEITVVRSVAEAKKCLEKEFDLLLLDVSLPDGTGFEVCEHVRGGGRLTPVIFLTAADDEVSVVRGLDGGGDDYVTKPFRLGELCSRIHALLRRANAAKEERDMLRSGNLLIDLQRGRAFVGDRALELTGAEYRLLTLLVRNAGIVVTRNRILESLWDEGGNFVDDNTVSVYIRRLREKIEEEPSRPKRLLTARGFGYRWAEE